MTMTAETLLGVLQALVARKEQIQSALDRQCGEGFTFQDVFDMIRSERALFFWNETSCAIIEVRKFPNEITLHVFLGAGTTEGLLELYELVADWGSKYIGASRMTTLCRKGFKRKLAKHGWKESQVWLDKDITSERRQYYG